MAEIRVPGDELERLGRLLAAVRETVGDVGSLASLIGGSPAGSLGDPRLLRAVDDFHGRWGDGHRRLRAETGTLDRASTDILRAFRDTDTGLASQRGGSRSTSATTAPSGVSRASAGLS